MAADGMPYADADVPDDESCDPITGEPLVLPTSNWLTANGVTPYWLAHFPYSTFHELYDNVDDTVPSAMTPERAMVGLEFRSLGADGDMVKTVICLDAKIAVKFCRGLIDALVGSDG